jgi:AraC-like DNA-binding protein
MKTIEIIEVKHKPLAKQSFSHLENVNLIEQKDISLSDQLLNFVSESIDFESNHTVNGTKELLIKNSSGGGKIDSTTFENQLKVINFDVCLNDDLIIDISHKKDTLYFIYTFEGKCYHSLNNSKKPFQVNELRTFSFLSCRSNHNQLIIKKGRPFKCNIITIDKDVYVKNFVLNLSIANGPLHNLHTIFETLKEQQLESSFSLNISKELRTINTQLNNESITSSLELQSRYQLILSYHIEQLYIVKFNKEVNYSISNSEIKKIRTISNHIIENPSLNHSQEQLCSQFFISQTKLQTGFKALHKTTVSNFTRNVRLEKSEELLLNSDLNISEIVYSVGLTSRSYFSKIFKQKYDCNPTEYRAQFILNKNFITLTH